MGSFLIQVSQIARELLSRAGNPDVRGWEPGQLDAILVARLREEGRPEVADAMVEWLAGGPDLAARFRSEEWEYLVGEEIWSDGEEA